MNEEKTGFWLPQTEHIHGYLQVWKYFTSSGMERLQLKKIRKHVKQELLTLPELMSSPPVVSAVRVARSLVLCVVFCMNHY
jgi:hypothetical protein